MREANGGMPVITAARQLTFALQSRPMPPREPETWQETTIDGPRTRRWVLECGECQEFNAHRIARLGMEEAAPPYRRVRLQPAGSFFLATTEGEGRILLD